MDRHTCKNTAEDFFRNNLQRAYLALSKDGVTLPKNSSTRALPGPTMNGWVNQHINVSVSPSFFFFIYSTKQSKEIVHLRFICNRLTLIPSCHQLCKQLMKVFLSFPSQYKEFEISSKCVYIDRFDGYYIIEFSRGTGPIERMYVKGIINLAYMCMDLVVKQWLSSHWRVSNFSVHKITFLSNPNLLLIA